MKLQELIAHLINEQGLSEEDALELASATIKARRGGNIQRTGTSRTAEERKFSPSAQDYDNPVDYGDETAAEAKERWLRQEMNDPDGLFAGGASMGGVFGEGVISTSDFDPMARSRTMGNLAQLQQLQASQEMIKLLQEMRSLQQQHQRELPPQEPPPNRLGGFGRFLASKKRDR